MPVLKLEKPAEVLEESINNVHFIRNIKAVKSKNLQELFSSEEQKKIIKMYAQLRQSTNRNNDDENENQIPNYTISIKELKGIIRDNAAYDLTDEVLELIFYALGMTLYQDTQVDFLLFVKIYYLIVQKEQGDEDGIRSGRSSFCRDRSSLLLRGRRSECRYMRLCGQG